MTTKKGAPYISRLSNHFEKSKEEFTLLIDAQGTNWAPARSYNDALREDRLTFFLCSVTNSADKLALHLFVKHDDMYT